MKINKSYGPKKQIFISKEERFKIFNNTVLLFIKI